jgi:hypothetical protein
VTVSKNISLNFNDIFLETVTSPVGDTRTLLSCDGLLAEHDSSMKLKKKELHRKGRYTNTCIGIR